MSLIATIGVSHPGLALIQTIQSSPVEEVRVVPQSTTAPGTGQFFFLVRGEDDATFDAFEDALEADTTVSEWTAVDDTSSPRVYRIRYTSEAKLLSPWVVDVCGLMLEAWSTGRDWTIRLRLPDRQALSDLVERCEAEGISVDLKQMYSREGWTDDMPGELTDEQYEALVTAYEAGYFEEPRDASLADLSEVLGISPTAVGGRIRRGTGSLIEATLIEE